ncbi:hypothetical protein LCGC14_0549470 [marine sediment metagenome]|uniref:Uncharacterized protein n=1 Tax=marine sediment metagenome TaxID=412755 RepID=A0A0F9UBR9_9ZZZZ
MITTGCEGCCFLKKDDKTKGCVLGQVCVTKDGQTYAPGYCRMCRSYKWARQQKTLDSKQLYDKVIEERKLKFDMLVYFDEAHNSLEDLDKTLQSDWYTKYANNIIIIDVTGFGDRKNLALQYIKTRKHSVPIVVDSSVAHELICERGETIRRVSQKITSPFFLVIYAGNIFINFDVFAETVQCVPSRVIHWLFPFLMGNTPIIPHELEFGLFITTPYKSLMKYRGESFTERLRNEEVETKMGLSCFCETCWLT